MFPGFETSIVDVGETTVFIRRKGSGKPVLLLHGFPETHLMWHRIAPQLAEVFTVICADLRGYGASGKPPSTHDHLPHSKGEMALDLIRMMRDQGFTRFAVAGHDRGARVAYRMALDHVDHVERLAVLDIIPTSEAFLRADARFALAFWPWSLLSQPAPLPERMIAGAEEAIVNDALAGWGSDPASFPPKCVGPISMHFAIPRPPMRSARIIALPPPSISSGTSRIARPACSSSARHSSCGVRAARSTPGMSRTAGLWKSGANGRST